MAWLIIPAVALILGLTLGHWLAIPMATLVWFVGVFLVGFFAVEGGGAMADAHAAIAMLPATYVAAGIGVALRRLVERRRAAA